jgi:glycosyltransferase involved in cell wall biosynthesis
MDVTIFIRTYNEGNLIRDCLDGIFSQKTEFRFEVVMLDSQSVDETQAIARKYDVALYEIDKELFSYSTALNFGIQQSSKSDFFVVLSGHCVPLNELWLQNLIQPLIDEASVAASFSRQIPWQDASEPERTAIEASFPATPRITHSEEFFQKLRAASDPYSLLTFSNASSCIRRSALETHPFVELPFAEDRAFVFSCYQNKQAIAYASDSVVYHSHTPSFREFRQIAHNATIARYQINAMLKESTPTGKRMRPPSVLTQVIKIPPVVGLFAVMSVISLGKLRFNKESVARYFRTVRYYFSSIGTTIGKLEAAISLLKNLPPLPSIADPSRLLETAKRVS